MDPISLVYGAIAGVGWGITGLFAEKAKGKDSEAFDAKLFLKTVIIGAAIGGIASFQGMTVDIAASAYLLPVTGFVDKLLSGIYRLFKR
jgi:hypothetical protein